VTAAARPGGPDRARLVVAGSVFAVAIAASLFCEGALSTQVAPDTSSYWATLPDLARRAPGGVPMRTPLYSVVFAVVHGLGGSGTSLLFFQFAVRGLACALVAWYLARFRPAGGLVVGLLLALDPIGAGMSTVYLTEGLYTAGLLLALAVVVGQLQDRAALTRARVFGAGLLLGWVLLFRPNGLILLGPALAAYWIATRSAAVGAWVLGGFGVVAGGVALYNHVVFGKLTLVASGIYLAFPLFANQLFDPANGPASAALHARLKECDPELDYRKVLLQTANHYIHGVFARCLGTGLPGEAAGPHDIYRRAYLEALRAKPVLFAERMAGEVADFLLVPASLYVEELAGFSRGGTPEMVCARQPPHAFYQPALVAFVCPLPRAREARRDWLVDLSRQIRLVYQPHLAVAQTNRLATGPNAPLGPRAVAGGTAVLYLAVALVIAIPPYRPWVAAGIVLVLANAAVTALGQVTLLRYVGANGPFLLMITGLTGLSLLERGPAGVRLLARRGGPAVSRA
jgi:hypothetical protein